MSERRSLAFFSLFGVMATLLACAPWRMGPFVDPHAQWCSSDPECKSGEVCRFPAAYGPHGELVHAVCVRDDSEFGAMSNAGYAPSPPIFP